LRDANTNLDKEALAEKLESLEDEMRRRESVLVAFSGGVDSSVVAKIAFKSLGDRALAVIADSETLPRTELDDAIRLAKEMGIPCEVVKFSELEYGDFAKNPPDRCYHCRKGLSKELKKIATSKNIDTIADGINSSDFGEHRPGIAAADEEGIWHPFVDLDIGKSEVRELARMLDISISEKPSMACMSSRIPYGEEITREKLERIEMAEEHLWKMGFSQVRVRAHKDIARIEVPRSELPRFLDCDTQSLVRKFKVLGFKYVTLDLEGYRSGSMDEVL
jgi:uncharacterized protein